MKNSHVYYSIFVGKQEKLEIHRVYENRSQSIKKCFSNTGSRKMLGCMKKISKERSFFWGSKKQILKSISSSLLFFKAGAEVFLYRKSTSRFVLIGFYHTLHIFATINALFIKIFNITYNFILFRNIIL